MEVCSYTIFASVSAVRSVVVAVVSRPLGILCLLFIVGLVRGRLVVHRDLPMRRRLGHAEERAEDGCRHLMEERGPTRYVRKNRVNTKSCEHKMEGREVSPHPTPPHPTSHFSSLHFTAVKLREAQRM